MIKKAIFLFSISSTLFAQSFSIARVHYSGGGDWYSDPSSLPNLLNYLNSNTPMSAHPEEFRIKLTDDDANQYPYLYMTGHGNVRFTDDEVIALRSILMNSGFLHADDNYGMDESFRREMRRVFPNKDLVTLPHDHPIFSSYYQMLNGLPKVHEHDNHPPQALALFEGERMIMLYTYESDLGDGWEDANVHHDPLPIREASLKMGVNIIYFALTQ
ncbi:MAG TPA: DUF4159 domain-containing protein [Candidatus Marinimicrobia bacterium]|nr:DUF4159 domain-containing protein [Candidatus Neomarinimicrobiota bacterium]